ncbi:hypothetical protein BH11PSE6_BH11PSE6_04840 [soil metagenome]
MRVGLSNLTGVFLASVALSGCMMPARVQRASVEYNSAVSGMANQLTLLNIARAKEGLPTFYTSLNRLSGTITVKAGASLAGQFKADQPTALNNRQEQGVNEDSTSTVTSATPSTTVLDKETKTITTLAQETITRGGNLYTPTVSGEVSSGPSFDIQILDTQQFYRGILSGIDGQTFLNFIDQGMNSDLLLRLLVYKIVFKATETRGPFEKGQVVHNWVNAPPGAKGTFDDIMARKYWPMIDCYALSSQQVRGDDTKIARVSRVVLKPDGSKGNLSIADLATLDGSQLALRLTETSSTPIEKKDIYVGSAKTADDALVIVKPGQSKAMAVLALRPDDAAPPQCFAPDKPPAGVGRATSAFFTGGMFDPVPDARGEDPGNKASSKGVLKIYKDGVLKETVEVQVELVPRSTEAVVQYLGAYVRHALAEEPAKRGSAEQVAERSAIAPYALHEKPLFTMSKGCKKEVVGVDLDDVRYCIEKDGNRARNMQIIALVEQLINLNKSGTERPTTVPVQVIQ